MSENHALRGVICTLLGGIGWGFSGACGQFLLQHAEIPTAQITLIRMFFAGIILILFNLCRKKKAAFTILKNKKNIIFIFLFALFGLITSQFTYLMAISYSNAGTATVLQYLGPVFIMIFVCITSRRLPTLSEAIAVILAFSGVALLATHGDFTKLQLSEECLFWGILSAVGLMMYSIIPKKLIKEWGAVTVSGYGMLAGGIIMFFFVRPWTVKIDIDLYSFAALCGMVIIGTVFAYTMYLQGVNDIKEVKASMIACIEPVSAAVFSFLWFKTAFLPVDIVGFVLILSTVFILNIPKKS